MDNGMGEFPVELEARKAFQAQCLLTLVKEHRASCDGDCNISLGVLEPIYRELVGRPLNDDEMYVFWF